MERIIAIAKKTGVDEKTGLDLKRGEAYQINEDEFDPAVFARPGEEMGEEVKVEVKVKPAKKERGVSDEK